MTNERIAELRISRRMEECLDTICQLQAEKDRLIAEVYRLNLMLNGTKAETSQPCDADSDGNAPGKHFGPD